MSNFSILLLLLGKMDHRRSARGSLKKQYVRFWPSRARQLSELLTLNRPSGRDS